MDKFLGFFGTCCLVIGSFLSPLLRVGPWSLQQLILAVAVAALTWLAFRGRSAFLQGVQVLGTVGALVGLLLIDPVYKQLAASLQDLGLSGSRSMYALALLLPFVGGVLHFVHTRRDTRTLTRWLVHYIGLCGFVALALGLAVLDLRVMLIAALCITIQSLLLWVTGESKSAWAWAVGNGAWACSLILALLSQPT